MSSLLLTKHHIREGLAYRSVNTVDLVVLFRRVWVQKQSFSGPLLHDPAMFFVSKYSATETRADAGSEERGSTDLKR